MYDLMQTLQKTAIMPDICSFLVCLLSFGLLRLLAFEIQEFQIKDTKILQAEPQLLYPHSLLALSSLVPVKK